jgi:hypothetical protein
VVSWAPAASSVSIWTLPDASTFPYIEVELTEVEFDPSLPV